MHRIFTIQCQADSSVKLFVSDIHYPVPYFECQVVCVGYSQSSVQQMLVSSCLFWIFTIKCHVFRVKFFFVPDREVEKTGTVFSKKPLSSQKGKKTYSGRKREQTFFSLLSPSALRSFLRIMRNDIPETRRWQWNNIEGCTCQMSNVREMKTSRAPRASCIKSPKAKCPNDH